MTGGEAALTDRLPERPPISTPTRARARASRRPGLGLAGVLLVAPVAWLIAFGAGGAEPSLLVLSPIVTFGLPAVATIAFWWEDWPGTRLRDAWSGWADTVVLMVAAILFTAVGQAIVSGFDVRALFDPSPGPGHTPTFPDTMPLAGAGFVAMLELTLVCEGWPLRRLPARSAGAAALAVAWLAALAVYFLAVDPHGPVPGADFGAALVVIGALQVWFYVAWRGWPFARIESRPMRLLTANATVIGIGTLLYVVAHDVAGVADAPITAAAGSFVAAGLLVGMLFDGPLGRAGSLATIVVLAAVLDVVLRVLVAEVEWTRGSADDWVAHAGLNAIGVAIILHVGIGRRWPFSWRR